MKYSLLTAAFAGALLLTGCSSISSMEHRAARYSQTWAKLSLADKERVRHGDFQPGDPIQLVYIRYGPPDKVRRAFNAAGQALDIWSWQKPEPVETVTIPWPASSKDYGVMSAGMPAKSPEQFAAESAAAERREPRQPIIPPAPRAASWDGGRWPPGPFLFENGVLVPSAKGYSRNGMDAKLQLPAREVRESGQVSG